MHLPLQHMNNVLVLSSQESLPNMDRNILKKKNVKARNLIHLLNLRWPQRTQQQPFETKLAGDCKYRNRHSRIVWNWLWTMILMVWRWQLWAGRRICHSCLYISLRVLLWDKWILSKYFLSLETCRNLRWMIFRSPKFQKPWYMALTISAKRPHWVLAQADGNPEEVR